MSPLPVGVSVRRATPGDEEALWAIQLHREQWLTQKGMPSLASNFDVTGQRAFLREHLVKSEVWVFEEKGRIIGQLRMHSEDKAFWGPRDEPAAGYVHGLSIAEHCHGRGLGLAILRWAEAQWKLRGKRFNRLDCSAENTRLLDYYRSSGYIDAGDVTLPNGWKARLFEKELV